MKAYSHQLASSKLQTAIRTKIPGGKRMQLSLLQIAFLLEK